mmetsp:Transcript_113470/g.206442  ORF Transcript_113470/g.206442 Transcript_113470/m.206442 type:complete len:207 (+) Transcript_113470:987-1607(+)
MSFDAGAHEELLHRCCVDRCRCPLHLRTYGVEECVITWTLQRCPKGSTCCASPAFALEHLTHHVPHAAHAVHAAHATHATHAIHATHAAHGAHGAHASHATHRNGGLTASRIEGTALAALSVAGKVMLSTFGTDPIPGHHLHGLKYSLDRLGHARFQDGGGVSRICETTRVHHQSLQMRLQLPELLSYVRFNLIDFNENIGLRCRC